MDADHNYADGYHGPTVEDLLDPNAEFKPEAIAAARDYARAKPWQGTIEERRAKLARFHSDACRAYGIEERKLVFDESLNSETLADAMRIHSAYQLTGNRLVMLGDLSVVTYLDALAQMRGMNPMQRTRFRINFFAKCFPRSFASCERVGVFLVKR